MDTNKFDNEIKELEAIIVNLQIKMTSIRDDMIKQLISYLQNKYRSMIEYEIKQNISVTKQHGIEKLGLLKNDLNELVTLTPDIVRNNFLKIWVYPPEKLDKIYQNDLYLNTNALIKDEIYKLIKMLLGYVGKLIIKYDYDKSNWEITNNNLPKYKYGGSYPEDIEKIINEYIKVFNDYSTNYLKSKNVKKQKEETEVMNLWEQA
jgi:hypothetical protein